MAFGFYQVIAPEPVAINVQSRPVANALATMGLLPRSGGDDRHIGINEWVDRVRLTLTDAQLDEVTLITWGLGIEGLLDSVANPLAYDDFDLFLSELQALTPQTLRDNCLHALVHSTHNTVLIDAKPTRPIAMNDLLQDRDIFYNYLVEHIDKPPLPDYFDDIIYLYHHPQQLKDITLKVLTDLWNSHFRAEWTRHQSEIDRIVTAFSAVDTSGLSTFEAMQVITGRDLRPIFRPEAIAGFEQIIFIPSKHNGPYIMWFGNEDTLQIVFTARMPSQNLFAGSGKTDVNVLIQRFKALSDDNRMNVLLAIKEQGELSTQDIIDQFDFNKSAVSRYLGQLFANDFITERRDADGKTKYYRLNPNMIDEFVRSIAQLLKDG